MIPPTSNPDTRTYLSIYRIIHHAPGRHVSGWKACFDVPRCFSPPAGGVTASGGGGADGASCIGDRTEAFPPPRTKPGSVSCRTNASLLGPLCCPRYSACT